MTVGMWRARGIALGVAAACVGAAFGIRAFSGALVENTGLLEQSTGTALYAAAVYAGVVFLRPAIAPVPAGIVALGFCWAVEFAQLSGIPAALAERSVIARLVLGASFDPADLVWYVVGVVPAVVAHRWRKR